jgi:pyruvate/2-oxoglutarate dehydrogenase complex dihydrolipoamide acyltransferase (E2) component
MFYSPILLIIFLDVGDFVKQDEEVATIETDKVDIPVNSPASGYILEHFAAEEDTIAVGQNLFKLDLQDAPKEGEQGNLLKYWLIIFILNNAKF